MKRSGAPLGRPSSIPQRIIAPGWMLANAFEDRTREFTEWEEEFTEEMDMLLRLGGHLNRKQEVILERIYAEKTP